MLAIYLLYDILYYTPQSSWASGHGNRGCILAVGYCAECCVNERLTVKTYRIQPKSETQQSPALRLPPTTATHITMTTADTVLYSISPPRLDKFTCTCPISINRIPNQTLDHFAVLYRLAGHLSCLVLGVCLSFAFAFAFAFASQQPNALRMHPANLVS